MEAQTWNHLPFQWRTPTLPDIVLSGVTAYVLHCQPDIPEPVAATAALMGCDRDTRQKGNGVILKP
ncbi:hypothetical protein ACFUIT_20365 [Streptomyces sp. NPDC057239]|uniref:hypothetical protein n=1 Tax=Streptomyces sp. NPDC057239 TaxID=3346061 RepID=UPI003632511A